MIWSQSCFSFRFTLIVLLPILSYSCLSFVLDSAYEYLCFSGYLEFYLLQLLTSPRRLSIFYTNDTWQSSGRLARSPLIDSSKSTSSSIHAFMLPGKKPDLDWGSWAGLLSSEPIIFRCFAVPHAFTHLWCSDIANNNTDVLVCF